ncbi:uncharacterized protein BJ171DRAFT_98586 [Polychytrium aggregatum]|uniref:uncharacterized protein n=1 Tax=Polychytrium aggregatum TaxID=110093 RepID=UPI0022FE4D4C|nr:uncharacterized protein BJ171DRAFT_98586 [Polychytrium aggregatum]KAI9204604.1 hypothetical protein BJ171DRAFT_98586 [Polychytrium aggregatum]
MRECGAFIQLSVLTADQSQPFEEQPHHHSGPGRLVSVLGQRNATSAIGRAEGRIMHDPVRPGPLCKGGRESPNESTVIRSGSWLSVLAVGPSSKRAEGHHGPTMLPLSARCLPCVEVCKSMGGTALGLNVHGHDVCFQRRPTSQRRRWSQTRNDTKRQSAGAE